MKAASSALIVLILLTGGAAAYAQPAIDAHLDDANKYFTYKGKPIHPGLVQEFSSWISDSGMPTTVTVDVSARHQNEYYEDYVKVLDDGSVLFQKKNEAAFFSYKWLGRLDNGLHVLSIAECTGGSGVFEDLFFVRFDKGEGLNPDGKKYARLLMTIVRTFPLGDRDHSEIRVLPDRVIVGASEYRDIPVTITF